MKFGKQWLVGVTATVIFGGVLLSQAPPQPGEGKKTKAIAEPEAKKPATHKVAQAPFHVELTAKGVLEPVAAAEIAFRSQPASQSSAGPLVIAKIVPHGNSVKKGDVLVAFQTERLDQMLRDLATDLHAMEVSLKISEDELPVLEKSAPIDLAAARRDKKFADEDLKYFTDVEKAEQIKQAEFGFKQAGFSLEYAKEELRQLEKMYKANDLTEETEQIILKRQRHYLEQAVYSHKRAEIMRDLTLKVTLPRRETTMIQAAVKQALTLERAEQTLLPGVTQKKYLLAKQRYDYDKLKARLTGLQKDLAGMIIHAPMDGMAYYGKFSAGAWSGAGPGKLPVLSSVAPDDVFMTVVKQRPVQMRWLVDEKDAGLIKSGLAGSARFAFRPELKATAKVVRLTAVPAAPGQFEALLAVELPASHAAIGPGMACTVKFTAYSKANAVAVPAAAVFEEGDKHVVFLADGSGKQNQREVTVGRTSNNRTEIIEGLEAGDVILLERPDAAK